MARAGRPALQQVPQTSRVIVRVLGCGDAFGSGGRFHTSFCVDGAGMRLLIDCGASTLIALHRHKIDPATIDGIVLSHLHGDHFGGIPFLLLDAAFITRRRQPLVIAGPAGTLQRLRTTTDALFPNFWKTHGHRHVEVVEHRHRRPMTLGDATVTPFRVRHDSGAPAFALRLTCGDCTIAYSGDTGWTSALVDAAKGSDLFLCEATSYDRPLPFHLTYTSVVAHRDEFRTARLMLTHLGAEMVDRAASLPIESVRDGQRIVVRARSAARRPPAR